MRREAMHNGWRRRQPRRLPRRCGPRRDPTTAYPGRSSSATSRPSPPWTWPRFAPQARRDLQGRAPSPRSARRTSTTTTARSASPCPTRRPAPSTSTSPGSRNATPDCPSARTRGISFRAAWRRLAASDNAPSVNQRTLRTHLGWARRLDADRPSSVGAGCVTIELRGLLGMGGGAKGRTGVRPSADIKPVHEGGANASSPPPRV